MTANALRLHAGGDSSLSKAQLFHFSGAMRRASVMDDEVGTMAENKKQRQKVRNLWTRAGE